MARDYQRQLAAATPNQGTSGLRRSVPHAENGGLAVGGTRLMRIAASAESGGTSDDGPMAGEAESEAVLTNSGPQAPCKPTPADPDLAALIAAWPALPAPIRAGIVAMVKAANP